MTRLVAARCLAERFSPSANARRVVAVAYSGGRDSTALLHAALAEAAPYGVEVFAFHVHHGLNPSADAWQVHCEAQCARWSRAGRRVVFVAHRIPTRPARGHSIEAWAREQRYAALQTMALTNGASLVLLAHHRRDQAETLLLQALRGAGVTGLSGMAGRIERDGIVLCRPWLEQPRAAIEAYVRRYRLRYVDDDSNLDPRFARNRLRLRAWPALAAAFPDAETTLATSARWAQQAQAALDELAALDLQRVATVQGFELDAWRSLTPARRSNALRAWLRHQQGGVPAPASLVTRLLEELPACRSARWTMGAAQLRLYRGVLRCGNAAARVAAPDDAPRETRLTVHGVGSHALTGWGGRLHVEAAGEGAGVPMPWLRHLELRPRAGAERFQSGAGRPPRSLKKQYQEAGVPMWERTGPLVYRESQLVYVPGLGLDARVIGIAGPERVCLRWEALSLQE